MKLTKQEVEVLAAHISRIISWGADGTFTKEKKGEWVFDKAEAKIAERAITKLIKSV